MKLHTSGAIGLAAIAMFLQGCPDPNVCDPGEQQICPCVGGEGVQECADSGDGWESCDCPQTGLICGDSYCQGGESCETCPSDCGTCNSGGCGDNTCGAGESCETCPSDCGDCSTCGPQNFTVDCGNGYKCPANSTCSQDGNCFCNEGYVAESCSGQSCTSGCPAPDWWCVTGSSGSCGNGMCDASESCSTCPSDCGGCSCTLYAAAMAPMVQPAFDCSIEPDNNVKFFMADINEFWKSGIVACPCNADAYQYGCTGNAFVTSLSPGYNFYDPNFLYQQIFGQGGFPIVGALILAHETGHNIQLYYNVPASSPIAKELEADCFAGYFLGYLQCDGMLSMADVQAAFGTACNGGDPWYAPGTHGTCTDRMNALVQGMNGYKNGVEPLVACTF
ncbi:MAG: hypothetical protein IPK82_29090 [Polyangiaceae bacterium]|nr:hypothetical protein [Polyangiaceae bacterium]